MQGRPKPARAFTTTASEREREQEQRDQIRAQQARVETVEKYSGLRIKNRVVAGMVVEDRFADLRFYRLKDLRHTVTGRWATAGVLVEKSMKSSSIYFSILRGRNFGDARYAAKFHLCKPRCPLARASCGMSISRQSTTRTTFDAAPGYMIIAIAAIKSLVPTLLLAAYS